MVWSFCLVVLIITVTSLCYCGGEMGGGACLGRLPSRGTGLSSLLSWIAGPFVDSDSLVNDVGELEPRFQSGSPVSSMTDSIERLRGQLPTRITFEVGSQFRRSPIELRWAPFRGNLRLVRLGESGDNFYLDVDRPVVQYTSAGHLFVVMSNEAVPGATYSTRHLPQEFLEVESLFDQIIGLYLVPISAEGTTVVIDTTSHAMFNLKTLLQTTSAYPECLRYMSGELTIEQSLGDPLVRACFRRLLLTYWEHQRLSQVPVHMWAVPAIPTVPADHHAMDNTAVPLWTLSSLSSALATEASSWYIRHRDAVARAEPPISLVFNQLESPTYYVSLPDTLQRRIVDEVHDLAAAWLGVPRDSLEVTGSYGCREYRTGAVVRWHVDPVESQPLTAIIHLSAGGGPSVVGVDGEQGSSHAGWSLQLPKDSDTFVGALSAPATGVDDDTCSSGQPCDLDAFHSIDLQAGQALLLQSAKLPHARLRSYSGEWYANAFVHMAPRGWAERDEVRALRD